MQLFIKTLTSIYPSFYIEIEKQDTILFLKEKIKEKKNIPIKDQKILYAGKSLENDKTFEENSKSTVAELLDTDILSPVNILTQKHTQNINFIDNNNSLVSYQILQKASKMGTFWLYNNYI